MSDAQLNDGVDRNFGFNDFNAFLERKKGLNLELMDRLAQSGFLGLKRERGEDLWIAHVGPRFTRANTEAVIDALNAGSWIATQFDQETGTPLAIRPAIDAASQARERGHAEG